MMTMMSGYRRLLMGSALLFFCLSGLAWRAAANTVLRDLTALQSLQTHWTTPNSHLPDWSGNDPCGTNWEGVVCGSASGDTVTSLSLSSYDITGGIPAAIGDLSSLELLELSFNPGLGGSLPKELGKLTSLTSLSIMNSGLTGSIPQELSFCVNISFLALNQNRLTGPIPDMIGNLKNMYWFDISENLITGPLPISARSGGDNVGLDNLTTAKHFHFNNNSIGGSLPAEIFNLPNLVHLLLDGNSLQGSIPSTLGNATSLQILRLDNNVLSGPLPAELNEMTGLIELHLSNNSFTQVLPNMSALTNLQLLDVSNNPTLSPQQVPSWIYSMNSVQTLVMDSAGLVGPLDSQIFNLAALQTLTLSNNALNGSVSFVGNSPSTLTLIDLQNNKFSGIEGSPMVNNIKSPVIELLLSGNPLCSYYSGLGYCKQANAADSWEAAPNPSCPPCSDGKTLNPIPCSCAFPLTCSMQLTSPTFQTINTTVIQSLSHEWAQWFQLEDKQVYIGSANFTNSRMFFNLQFFPVSGPSLSTDKVNNITSGLTSPTTHAISEGPYILRDIHFPPTSSTSKNSSHVALIIGIVAAVVGLVTVILLIAAYAIRQKKRADKAEVSRPFASWGQSTGDHGEAPQLKGSRWFSLAELRKVTNNFNDDNQIGVGGYGKVYRAELPSGDVVAVKRASEGSMQGDVEFKNEIELLSRVHHKHLVGLIGFCYEQGEQMLVYEFMPKGTLRDHLLGRTDYPLTWDARVAIALGSARGIAYLHEMANPPIIHRDVKSSNILLDKKMIAKVADFGLSKVAPDGADKRHVSTQVKGTLGYLDPEYYMTNQLSEKSDVYSFGVLLLEMLSARPPIERGRYIVREVRTALDKGGIKALVPLLDPFLGTYPQQQLEAVLDLALRCVEETGVDRPTMNEVVKELEIIAGNSQPNSGVHITVEPQKGGVKPYGRDSLKNDEDPSFHYSGTAFMHGSVEPK